jgi:hypothetical protein
LYIEEK